MIQTIANPLVAMKNFVNVYTGQIKPSLEKGDYEGAGVLVLGEVTAGTMAISDISDIDLAIRHREYTHYAFALQLLAGLKDAARGETWNRKLKMINRHVLELSELLK